MTTCVLNVRYIQFIGVSFNKYKPHINWPTLVIQILICLKTKLFTVAIQNPPANKSYYLSQKQHLQTYSPHSHHYEDNK